MRKRGGREKLDTMAKSVKLIYDESEEARLLRRAKQAGYVGRGAIVSYLRHLAGLTQLTPGAKPGNQNRLGKTKNHYETIRPKPTTTRRRANGKETKSAPANKR
jgi:hypothetical protein